MSWIQTFTGRKFDPMQPYVYDVCIEDIAHALALTCRFSGHCQTFYSVAQHSILVSHIVPDCDALWGLLHDAAEAYLVDLPRPIKQALRQQGNTAFDDMEAAVMRAVCARFGLNEQQPQSVSEADLVLLATEARDLMAPLDPDWLIQESNGYKVLPEPIGPLTPGQAESAFLFRFSELTDLDDGGE